MAALFMTCALILDSVALARQEQKRMRYLSIPDRHGWINDQAIPSITRAIQSQSLIIAF